MEDITNKLNLDMWTPAAESYLRATVRQWLGIYKSSSVEIPTLPNNLREQLFRAEEFESDHRDEWGNWEYAYSSRYHEGKLWVPEIDEWLSEQRSILSRREELLPLWPEGKKFAFCVTHDVDRVSNVSTISQAWRSLICRLESDMSQDKSKSFRRAVQAFWGFANQIRRARVAPPTLLTLDRCVDIERQFSISASYFFTAYPRRARSAVDCVYLPGDQCTFRGQRMTIGDMIVRLGKEGHDIGLHGSFHTASDKDLFREQKELLERSTARVITTTRQHYLHWDIRRTPHLQAESGIGADSTLGYNRDVGFRAGTSLPFYWFDLERQESLDLLMVPLIVEDAALLSPLALDLSANISKNVLQRLIENAANNGAVFTILFHPDRIADDRVLSLFSFVVELAMRLGAWPASVAQLRHWWSQRARDLEEN